MAYEKTIWVDGETEIDAQKLNKIEEGIVEAGQTGGILVGSIVAYDGDTVPEGYEEVDGLNDYSTEEKQISYWFDGKPLYRKTYNTYEQSDSLYYLDKTDFVKNINIKIGEGSVLIKHQTIADASYIIPIAKIGSPLGDFYWALNKYDKRLFVERTNYVSEYLVAGIELTIYYTKNTD